MLQKILVSLSVILLLGLLAYFAWWIVLLSAFGLFDKDYSVTDLKENFERNKTEIYELKAYFDKIVPENRIIEIEFINDKTLGRLGIYVLDSKTNKITNSSFLDWNLKTNTPLMDSLLATLDWTEETLAMLKDKLDKADCIQIENGEPTKIGFQRSRMGMYSFNLFSQPIPNSLKSTYKDSCTYIMLNDKLALEYRGGAIGPQCFYNLE